MLTGMDRALITIAAEFQKQRRKLYEIRPSPHHMDKWSSFCGSKQFACHDKP
jgi:hypothetical protein